jgi:hypothetical protein
VIANSLWVRHEADVKILTVEKVECASFQDSQGFKPELAD